MRAVIKTNDRDATTLSLEDRIHDPTTLGIFGSSTMSFFDVFGEFAAVSAGEGGNKTDDGASVEEDYFRLTVGGIMPTGLFDLKATYIFKTLSYADNRNVSLTNIARAGPHGMRFFR